MSRKMSYEGRSAIVTGGASGIGLALGRELCRAGANVVLADVDEAAAERAAGSLRSTLDGSSGTAVGVGLDVRDRSAVRSLVDEVVESRSGLDLMFNNAGIVMGGPTEDMSGDYWDRIIEVNLVGVVNGVMAAYPAMVARGRGHIVNTASAAGLAPAVFAAAYSMTKHGVVGLSTSLRPEAADNGVQVSVLCPGMVETPILDKGPPAGLAPPVTSANGRTLSGRKYLETVGMSPIDADDSPRRALRGVARNRSVIVMPASVKGVWYLDRLSPGLVGAISRSTARKVRREMTRATTGPARDG